MRCINYTVLVCSLRGYGHYVLCMFISTTYGLLVALPLHLKRSPPHTCTMVQCQQFISHVSRDRFNLVFLYISKQSK